MSWHAYRRLAIPDWLPPVSVLLWVVEHVVQGFETEDLPFNLDRKIRGKAAKGHVDFDLRKVFRLARLRLFKPCPERQVQAVPIKGVFGCQSAGPGDGVGSQTEIAALCKVIVALRQKPGKFLLRCFGLEELAAAFIGPGDGVNAFPIIIV